jgi:hypothetical protein
VLNHSSTIQIASSLFLLVFWIALVGLAFLVRPWCSDCRRSTFYLKLLSSSPRSPPIDLPLPLRRSGLNLSSPTLWQGDVYSTVVLCTKNCFCWHKQTFMHQGDVEGGGLITTLNSDMSDITCQGQTCPA